MSSSSLIANLPVPATYAGRVVMSPLATLEHTRTLFVGVRPWEDLRDGRTMFAPAQAALSVILDRGERWWAVRRHVTTYHWDDPASPDAPDTLAIVDLDDEPRVVLGAWPIDPTGWPAALANARSSALLKVPTLPGAGDQRNLRGRRVRLQFDRSNRAFAVFDRWGNRLP